MTICLSNAMADKLGIEITTTAEVEANPLWDWAAHLFRCGRRQYVLVVNTTSLFPVVLEGRGLKNEKTFLNALLPALRDQHRIFDLEAAFDRYIMPTDGSVPPVIWSKVGLRQVTGSMNRHIEDARMIVEDAVWDGYEITPQQLSLKLNENIFTMLAYSRPSDAHRRMIESLTE